MEHWRVLLWFLRFHVSVMKRFYRGALTVSFSFQKVPGVCEKASQNRLHWFL